MSETNESGVRPQQQQPATPSPLAVLGNGPYAAILGLVITVFGGGGIWSVEGLKTAIEAYGVKLEQQNVKMSEIQLTLAKIESRNAGLSETQNLTTNAVARLDDRVRKVESDGDKREFRLASVERALEAQAKLLDELRRASPR